MQKSKLAIILTTLFFLTPVIAFASPCPGYENAIVPCGQTTSCPCQISDLFLLILRVFNFLVVNIATPLAALMIVIGGVMFLISAGNPGIAGRAKHILWWTVIAVVIIMGSYLIIDIVLKAIGYTRNWSVLP